MLDEDRNQIFAEAIDVILAIWAGETPYDIDFENNRFKVTTAETRYLDVGYGIMPKTYPAAASRRSSAPSSRPSPRA